MYHGIQSCRDSLSKDETYSSRIYTFFGVICFNFNTEANALNYSAVEVIKTPSLLIDCFSMLLTSHSCTKVLFSTVGGVCIRQL